MWDVIVTTGGWLLFCVLVFFLGRWSSLERNQFANGDSRYLE
jgi:hypothetical protein